MNLTDEQQQVVAISAGRHLVLAPPGSGKTEMLSQRIVRAAESGIDPARMLCATFTNRAAFEMRTRHPAASGLGMPRGPASRARGVSRRVSAPREAGFAGADGTGLRTRRPFSDPQAGRARAFQRNVRLETESNSLPNENTMHHEPIT